jgi:nitronate monooxygenase
LAKEETKGAGRLIAINIMVAIVRDYENSVRGALEAGVDAIISGAGLPLNLPTIQDPRETALIPIVSSSRALELICRRWEKKGYRPDAAVLEGPLAGGHLGFNPDQIEDENFSLEKLFPPVKDVAMKRGDFPVIVAGGIYSHEDIVRWQEQGADGVQMGTRFLTTYESSATLAYKKAVVHARKEDISVVFHSPCKMPFRILKGSPMHREMFVNPRPPKCDKGYLLWPDDKGNLTHCEAQKSGGGYFCICNGLLSSAGINPHEESPLYTVGTNADRVRDIVPVKVLMDELKGK